MHKIKYMITGIEYLSNSNIRLHVLIKHFIKSTYFNGYIPLIIKTDSNTLSGIRKIRKWNSSDIIEINRYIYIYKKTNNVLLFKNLKHENDLAVNSFNSYDNELIYKCKLW